VELGPVSVSIRRTVGWVRFYARRFDEARPRLERAVAMNPTADETYRVLALCHAMAGDLTDAERAVREAVALAPGGTYNRATLAYVLARAGRRLEAIAELEEITRIAEHEYVSPVSFATVYLGLEDWDRALDWTERAYDDRRGWMAYLRVNPILDGLRGMKRFEALVAKMKL